MRIVVRAGRGDHEVDVELLSPEATVDDLLRAVPGVSAQSSVALGGRVVAGSSRVVDCGLHEGAILTLAADERKPAHRSRLELVIVAGVDAGRAYPLAAGRSVIGRDPASTVVLED